MRRGLQAGIATHDLATLSGVDCGTFFTQDPVVNPARRFPQGVIRSLGEEDIKGPLMQEIRHLDKLGDELATWRAMEKGFCARPRESRLLLPFRKQSADESQLLLAGQHASLHLIHHVGEGDARVRIGKSMASTGTGMSKGTGPGSEKFTQFGA